MRTFLRSMLAVCAFAPMFACAAETGEDTGSASEALCKDPPCGGTGSSSGGGVSPPPPPPAVSPPDVSFQIVICLSPSQEATLVTALKTAFPQAADVLTSCSGSERIGIWLKPEAGTDTLAARQRGLPGVNILAGSDLFAGHIAGAFLSNTAYAGWNAAPKVLNTSGNADPNGSIHLNSFNITTNAPTQWISTIGGTDTDPWPDVDFTLKTTDTLSVANGRIVCNSQNAFNADTSLLNVLTGVFLLAFPPLGGFFLYEDIMASGADTPTTTSGSLLCPAVSIFPSQILLPGTNQKATFNYQRAVADNTGITVGGSMAIVDRAPAAAISGAASVAVQEGATSAFGSYAALVTDMLSPQYTWTSSGSVSAPNGSGTSVRYALTGSEPGGTSKGESVHLQVVDADNPGASASASKAVTVKITPEDPLPPICRIKPYLPQCRNAP